MKIKFPIACPIALALIGTSGCGYFSKQEVASYDYGTEKVKNEQFIVAFSEGGELVAVDDVKVENEMDGSSTIVSIIDEGSTVKGPKRIQAQPSDTPAALAKKYEVSEEALRHVNPDLEDAIRNTKSITIPGDLLVELDPGSLKDKILNQEIAVRTAKNSVTKAENDLEIQRLKNQQSIDNAGMDVQFSKLDLEKFKESDAALMREDYKGSITNLANQVKRSKEQMGITEAQIVAYRELEKKQFLSKIKLRQEQLNLQTEQDNVTKYLHSIKMLRRESDAYEKYEYKKLEANFTSLIKQSELSLATVRQTATNNMITATTDLETQKQKLELEKEQLIEVKDQMNKTRIYAPSSGLVVYHVGESSRYGGSSTMIEKGATLRKGQDIIHLPDLSQMMVALKIHESRINQVQGQKEVQTKTGDTVAKLAERYERTEKALRECNEEKYPNPTRPREPEEETYPKLEEAIENGKRITIPGLPVLVRIDTVPDRSFKGEIAYVAPVASAAERWGSNKKVFKCEVSIKEDLPPYVRPGASATCRIFVANLPKVREVNGKKVKTLKVPIQSVVTTTEGRRVCFKMNKKGQPVPIPVDTGYYDQTHIQVTQGLSEGETVLKAPLLHAKELNVGGSLFGYRKLGPEDLGVELPETKAPAKLPPSTASSKGKGNDKANPAAVAQTGNSRPGGSRGGGSGRSSAPPAELNLTEDQKAKWESASNKMREEMRGIFTSGIPREQMQPKTAQLRAAFESELKKFLSKEQLTKYQQSRSQRSQGGRGAATGAGGSSRRRGSLMDNDTNGDGKISEEEYSKIDARMLQFIGEFSSHDTNGDGAISKEEADAAQERMMQRLRQQFQGGGGPGGGGE